MASTESDSEVTKQKQQAMLARHRTDASNGAKPGMFPLGYKEGFNQWWAGLSPAVTEHRVLSFIPYLQAPPTHTQTGSAPPSAVSAASNEVTRSPEREAAPAVTGSSDPWGPRRWCSDLVQLSGKDRYLNEFSVERVGEKVDNHLVMLHGYGAGLGFFYNNFEPLSRRTGWKLHALDMLGMGRSSRPPFKIHAKTKEGKITEAENWFIDSLEEWRVKSGIKQFTLLGHSLGGYMATAYTLKYPGSVNKLILASPVGIPLDPRAEQEDMPEPDESTMGNEFTQGQSEAKTKKAPLKPLPKWLTTLWDMNVSPFSVVRLAGPLGPRLVSGWTGRRFGGLEKQEAQALHDYSYSLFRQQGSGEYALAYILAPGAYARSALIKRVQGLGRQWLDQSHAGPTPDETSSTPGSSRARETGIPVIFMYGSNDWMSKEGGEDAVKKMQAAQEAALKNATPEERARENGDQKVVIVPGAGHHLYLDNHKFFNEAIDKELADVEKRNKRLEALSKI